MAKDFLISITVSFLDNEGTEQEINGEYLTWESAEEGLGKLELAYDKGVAEAEQRAKDALDEKSEE